MKTIPKLTTGLLLTLICGALVAGPAPWYQWRSKADGKQVCHQTPLGPGWEKVSGPFKDSHCTKSIVTQ